MPLIFAYAPSSRKTYNEFVWRCVSRTLVSSNTITFMPQPAALIAAERVHQDLRRQRSDHNVFIISILLLPVPILCFSTTIPSSNGVIHVRILSFSVSSCTSPAHLPMAFAYILWVRAFRRIAMYHNTNCVEGASAIRLRCLSRSFPGHP